MSASSGEDSDALAPLTGDLAFRVWVTRGVYFTFAERLTKTLRSSVYSITILSFYVVVGSVVSLMFPDKFTSFGLKLMGAANLLMSIFIIIINLMESTRNLGIESERASSTARKLEQLYNKFTSLINVDIAERLRVLEESYSAVLFDSNCRFGRIDYHYFQLDNPRSFKLNIRQRAIISLIYAGEWIREYWLYTTFTVGPPILAALCFFVLGA